MAEKKPSKTNLLLDDRDSKAEKSESPLEFLGKFKLRYYTLIGNWNVQMCGTVTCEVHETYRN